MKIKHIDRVCISIIESIYLAASQINKYEPGRAQIEEQDNMVMAFISRPNGKPYRRAVPATDPQALAGLLGSVHEYTTVYPPFHVNKDVQLFNGVNYE